ncbi:MAG: hypothetical protein CVU46_08450 [Chloroflexi bacterium HGW-Chloroflexi-8]|nr:MAG: hypothetical protein CVU46_08450 [Chloroflexi bacterium HGW-Chloroflexi-8]
MDISSINTIQPGKFLKVIKTLQYGDMNVIGQPLVGSNATLLVSCCFEGQTLHAIYKPDQGEQPLWDFPRNSLSKREIAAFVISYLIGWNFVPPTVFRVHKAIYGKGSLQFFIPHDPRLNYFNLPTRQEKIIQQIVLFDIIINNADRKAGHIIQDENGKIWLIDHGVCFHQEPKLRTVIWDYAKMKIPTALLLDLNRLLIILRKKDNKLAKKLNKFLSSGEIFMIESRLEKLIESGIFPSFEKDKRPYPWPLI